MDRQWQGYDCSKGIGIVLLSQVVIKGERKYNQGTFVDADAYSAFASRPDLPPASSPLTCKLRGEGITQILVVGIATDYCVRYSALDAAKAGFETFIIRDAVRAVGGDVATHTVANDLDAAGIRFISLDDPKVTSRL